MALSVPAPRRTRKKTALRMMITALLASAFCAVSAAAASVPFYADVGTQAWYYGDVRAMTAAGILAGETGDAFAPDAPICRAAFVTALGRLAGVDAAAYEGKSVFADVTGETSAYVAWAAEQGVTQGVSQRYFAPQAPITRQDMALMLARYLTASGAEPGEGEAAPFADGDAVSDYAVQAVEQMHRTGLMQGDDQGNFRPQSSITKAESAAILARLTEHLGLELPAVVEFLPDMTRIIHAAGELEGLEGSNSLEALQLSYDAGYRAVEIDFNFTSDGHLACIHDWDSRFSAQITAGTAPTLEEFLSCRIYGRFTPLWLGSLADFLRRHEGLYIVTDVKEDNLRAAELIRDTCPDLMDRFIIQIYNESQYDAIRALGFEHILFTLYMMPWNVKTDTEYLARFARTHPLLGYTFADVLCDRAGYVEGMKKAGVPLYVHTVNDPQRQEALFRMGISGVYTDCVS